MKILDINDPSLIIIESREIDQLYNKFIDKIKNNIHSIDIRISDPNKLNSVNLKRYHKQLLKIATSIYDNLKNNKIIAVDVITDVFNKKTLSYDYELYLKDNKKYFDINCTKEDFEMLNFNYDYAKMCQSC